MWSLLFVSFPEPGLLVFLGEQVIACGSSAGQIELGEANVMRILALLLTHSQSDEEGVRNVVAECLGKLILIDPATVLPALQVRIQKNLSGVLGWPPEDLSRTRGLPLQVC